MADHGTTRHFAVLWGGSRPVSSATPFSGVAPSDPQKCLRGSRSHHRRVHSWRSRPYMTLSRYSPSRKYMPRSTPLRWKPTRSRARCSAMLPASVPPADGALGTWRRGTRRADVGLRCRRRDLDARAAARRRSRWCRSSRPDASRRPLHNRRRRRRRVVRCRRRSGRPVSIAARRRVRPLADTRTIGTCRPSRGRRRTRRGPVGHAPRSVGAERSQQQASSSRVRPHADPRPRVRGTGGTADGRGVNAAGLDERLSRRDHRSLRWGRRVRPHRPGGLPG